MAEDQTTKIKIIRGDRVIRWVVVLLAFLLACTEINTSSTLVHVRSGEYMASHGLLPSGTDVFSYTTANRVWVNLSWMYDLLVATLHSVGGMAALTLFKASIIGLTFWLLTSLSVRSASSWWTSICATIALFACYPQFTATPQTITFLGVVLMLWLLFRWRTNEDRRYLWGTVLLIFVWGQFDSDMFLGLAILLMYGLGDLVGVWVKRPSLETSAQRKMLWKVIGVSFLVAMIHPFGWHTVAQPWQLFGVEYPALRARFGTIFLQNLHAYHPVASSFFWGTMNRSDVTGLILLLVAFLCFCLNIKKVDAGELFIYSIMVCFAMLASHFLAMAAVVSALLAAINVQQWYRDYVDQNHDNLHDNLIAKIDFAKRLFSYGGRAITLLALVGFALLAISGRLAGERGDHVGLGLHPSLKVYAQGMQEDLAETFDDQPFHFTIRQGDLLIWVGKKSFIDSRLRLFCGTGKNDLLKEHDILRHALHPKDARDPYSGKPEVWKKAFDKYHVVYVIPRLFGIPPDYHTHFGLLISPHWKIRKLGSATSLFYRADLIQNAPVLADFWDRQTISMVQKVFRKDVPQELTFARSTWSQQPGWLDQHFFYKRPPQSPALHEAYHCVMHLQLTASQKLPIGDATYVAMAYQTIRKTNEVLAKNPNNEEAYRMMGMAYRLLGRYEAAKFPIVGTSLNRLRRYYQTLSAISQAVAINPNNPQTRLLLYEIQMSRGKRDLALQQLEAYHQLTSNRTVLTPNDKALKRRLRELRDPLEIESKRIDDEIQLGLKNNVSPHLIAERLADSGYILKALDLLNKNSALYQDDPSAQLFEARLRLETGEVKKTYQIMKALSKVAQHRDLRNWQEISALTHMAHGEYVAAVPFWEQAAKQKEREQALELFQTFPLTIMSLPKPLSEQRPFPLSQTWVAPRLLGEVPQNIAMAQFNAALCEIEAGHNSDAEKRIRNILKQYPNPPHRSIMRFYLFLLSNEWVDVSPPSDWIPNDGTLFEQEEKQ